MKGYHDNIETLTTDNGDFRRVLYTGKHLQLVLMTLQPGEEIGSEVHDGPRPVLPLRGRRGRGRHRRQSRIAVEDGSGVIVPAGARHNVRNTGDGRSSSTPSTARPSIKDGIVQATKADADARHHDEEWDGKTTE